MSDWQWLKLQKKWKYWQKKWALVQKRGKRDALYGKTFFQKQVLEFAVEYTDTGSWPKPVYLKDLPQSPDIKSHHSNIVQQAERVLKSL